MNYVFLSYSHKDECWKDCLEPHLSMLEKHGRLTYWDDRKIDTGADWYPEIQAAMEQATVAILLISADYLSSDFCLKEEIPFLLERRAKQGVLVIPILIHPCCWDEIDWLKTIQMIPRDGKSVAVDFKEDYNTIFANVAKQIVNFQPAIVEHEEPAAPSIPALRDKAEEEIEIETPPAIPIDIERLPVTGAELFGRQKELKILDDAWELGDVNVISFVAWGGVGKSTLVNKWIERMAADNYRSAKRVYAWSFYSQGTGERVTSADQFISHALKFFGDPDPAQSSPWDKGKRLASLIRTDKTLLILDGLEPLQSDLRFEYGKIKDPALSVLVSELAKGNHGLCVITSRMEIAEMLRYPSSVRQVDLEQISDEAGRALLRVRGVRGSDAELEGVTRAFSNHALAINLLAEYLHLIPGHSAQAAHQIPDLDIPEQEGKYPRRVMEAFAAQFGEGAELELLCVLGLFDRPAAKAAIDAVIQGKPIKGLTAYLSQLSESDWLRLLQKLRDLKLIARESKHRPYMVDCHPLVREHFGGKLRSKALSAWRSAHSRLYEYYKNLPKKQLPDTLEEMEPLFVAVAHGCQTGKHQEIFYDVYWERIDRKNEFYSTNKLGAFGADLAALSNFFEIPWSKIVTNLTDADKAVTLSWAGFRLQALGRLREAAQPMQATVENFIKQKDLKQAALNAGNLSQLYLTLGEVEAAVSSALQSVDFADRSVDDIEKMMALAGLADSLHQAGELAQAADLFREAEAMQQKLRPEYRYLYSLRGFQFCDLLLSQGKEGEVLDRAEKSIEWEKQMHGAPILDFALHKLSLGRAYLLEAVKKMTVTS
jgi:tetratricopeptide (TPR) repeat protein